MRKPLLVASACMAFFAAVCHGMFKMSDPMPMDRALANAEQWTREKPKDPQGYYVLGRLHAMNWAFGKDRLRVYAPFGNRQAAATQPGLPTFYHDDSVQVRRDEDKKKNVTAEDAQHLQESIKNYRKAVELDPKSELYELGLAWMLQETGKVAEKLPVAILEAADAKPTEQNKASYDAAVKQLGADDAATREKATASLRAALPKSMPTLLAVKSNDPEVTARVQSILKTYWDLQAIEHYRKAYTMNPEARKFRQIGPGADTDIVYEASQRLIELLQQHPEAAQPQEVNKIEASWKEPGGMMGMAVTPIIFTPPEVANAPQTLADLIAPAARVSFDLMGDGRARQWPWVKPGTALLVWDPYLTGHVTSGRQLFGSRTWWIFFRNGYEALSLLDDNRDSQLTGSEMDGIAVWIDHNGNGISEPGEVISLQQAHITTIDLHAAISADGTLQASRGITFSTGQTTPTFDWVTAPHPEPVSPLVKR